MPLLKSFRGLRPAAGRESDVVAPPYDVVSRDEAAALVEGRPWSFLHVSRPEIDLPAGTDPYAPEVYAKARENLDRMLAEGVIAQDEREAFYVYRLTMGAHVQTGLVAAASVQAYDEDRIKKHEFTRPVKEDDRVRQIDALNAQTGPVFLVYRAEQAIDEELARASRGAADCVTELAGVKHEIWVLSEADAVARLTRAFDALGILYVADGHHRSAAASRVRARRKAANPGHAGDEEYNYFLSVVFPHDQMQILDYNRVVRDLNGMDPDRFRGHVAERFLIEQTSGPEKPRQPGQFAMYLPGQWYRLILNREYIPGDDPVGRLDVSLLANNLIEPVLGISDPRRDERIDFVGGIRGLEALQQRVDSGDWAVAFALYPTAMEDLMRVADAGEVMPPKSTWFEPKLADGLVSHVLD